MHDALARGAIAEEDAMTTARLTEADIRLRDAVLRQLDWDPEIDATSVAVEAHKGIITLTGYVDSYSEKLEAEDAARQVKGVRAIANDLEVRLTFERTEADIAKEASPALRLQVIVPAGIQAPGGAGCVTLIGQVTWPFQKADAEQAVQHIPGVRAVMNHIALAPEAAEHAAADGPAADDTND